LGVDRDESGRGVMGHEERVHADMMPWV
jgi:hypothetical protein